MDALIPRRDNRAAVRRARAAPVGEDAARGLDAAKAAVREMWEPTSFFENLGVRYVGPFDGHDIAGLEHALANAAELSGPTVVQSAASSSGTGMGSGGGRRQGCS